MRAQDSAGLAKAVFTVNNGDVEAGLKSAAKTVSSTYTTRTARRGVIGPACAVADVQAELRDDLDELAGRAGRRDVGRGHLGIPAQNGRVYWYEGSSSYGSAQSSSDTPRAAALISKLTGKPIRLQFMRWDEHGWDNYQSAQLMDVRGGVDASGKLTAYDYTLMQSPYSTVIDLTVRAHRVAVPDDDDRGQVGRSVVRCHVLLREQADHRQDHAGLQRATSGPARSGAAARGSSRRSPPRGSSTSSPTRRGWTRSRSGGSTSPTAAGSAS